MERERMTNDRQKRKVSGLRGSGESGWRALGLENSVLSRETRRAFT
jgi:hypothetical protein